MGRLISDQSLAVVPGVTLAAQDSPLGRLRGRCAAVRAKNPIRGCEQQSCGASGLVVMITDHVPAVRLLRDHADGRGAAAVVSIC